MRKLGALLHENIHMQIGLWRPGGPFVFIATCCKDWMTVVPTSPEFAQIIRDLQIVMMKYVKVGHFRNIHCSNRGRW